MEGERLKAGDEDAALIQRFLEGDASAFDQLFTRYQVYVYNIIYGIVGNAEEARDLTQDVFIQVHRSLARFRHGSRFATWLYRIAANRAVDAARGARRWSFLPIREEASLTFKASGPETEPEKVLARSEDRTEIQAILMRCSVTHRQVLVLKYYRELSIEEIAETLSCSLSAAKVRLHRARLAFKQQYERTYGVSESSEERDVISSHR
jgi:RNA polymerase sigma-70 factor (ECF subfamily)